MSKLLVICIVTVFLLYFIFRGRSNNNDNNNSNNDNNNSNDKNTKPETSISPSPINCVMSTWSDCSSRCGQSGTRYATKTITEKNGGVCSFNDPYGNFISNFTGLLNSKKYISCNRFDCETVITNNTIITIPTEVTKLKLTLIGGGGAGSRDPGQVPISGRTETYSFNNFLGGGAGSLQDFIINITDSNRSMVIQIGSGGTNGGNGGNTTVTIGNQTYTSTGGKGSSYSSNGPPNASERKYRGFWQFLDPKKAQDTGGSCYVDGSLCQSQGYVFSQGGYDGQVSPYSQIGGLPGAIINFPRDQYGNIKNADGTWYEELPT